MKYNPGNLKMIDIAKNLHAIEMALTNRFLLSGAISDVAEQKDWRRKIEEASLGKNTVIFDDKNNPSVMCYQEAFAEKDVVEGGTRRVHPAFIVNGVNKPGFYIAKYQAATVGSGVDTRAISLYGLDPKTSVTFDNAKKYTEDKGVGFHLVTNAEWSAIALLAKKRGFMPRGNTYYGASHTVASEMGVPSYSYKSGNTDYVGRTATGSGPLTWSIDGTPFGPRDMCGNVWEWAAAGFRLNNGEIQIVKDNDAAVTGVDLGVASALWKAILPDGTLVDPGTPGTLKLDAVGPNGTGDIKVNTELTSISDGSTSASSQFKDISVAAGVNIPTLLKLLGIYPVDTNIPVGRFYMRNTGERMPFRGGYWANSANAGVFACSLYSPRANASDSLGFRFAFLL